MASDGNDSNGVTTLERPDAEFARLHDGAVAGERWVMDGNYSALLPRRLERATGLIVIESTTTASLVRYVRRTLVPGRRVGGLDGVRRPAPSRPRRSG